MRRATRVSAAAKARLRMVLRRPAPKRSGGLGGFSGPVPRVVPARRKLAVGQTGEAAPAAGGGTAGRPGRTRTRFSRARGDDVADCRLPGDHQLPTASGV